MWSEKRMIEYLKQNLKESRVEHSLGVRDTAEKLAVFYGADHKKARIAGLIHDCAKNKKKEELLSLLAQYEIIPDEISKQSSALLHGIGGALLAKEIMKVEDEEVLSAIVYHTTGKAKMNLLEKLVYLADYIEPSRKFPGVEAIRKKAYEDLDEALLLSLDKTIAYVMERGELLHLDTVSARNDLLFTIKKNKNVK